MPVRKKAVEDAKAEITKVIQMMVRDLVTETEGTAMLAPLRLDRDRNQAILDSVEEPENIIELQPKAVRRFRENVESLARIVQGGGEV